MYPSLSKQATKQILGFAYLTAAHLHKRLPNSITKNKTPYEMFYGRKPQLDSLRVFGSTAFVHIYAGQRPSGKFEDRGRKCVIIGYVTGGKGWMFYDENTKTAFPSAIAQFPHESGKTKSSTIPTSTSSPSLNKVLHTQTNKGSLNRIINALQLGNFSTEVKLDSQDAAASHALGGNDYIKILQPPKSYAEAMRSPHLEQWRGACDAEMKMMEKMNVWEVVYKPAGLVSIGLKWVFTYKKVDDEGNPTKFKSRLVAKGYSQKEGMGYIKTFAPTATFPGLRIMLTIAAHQNWPVNSFDITSAYLHSDIDSAVYFSIPTGYLGEAKKKNQVLKALKALYGTKQGARCWWKHIHSILQALGFSVSQYDQSLYVYRRGSDTCIMWVHSDDGAVTGSSEALLDEIHSALEGKLLIKWEEKLDQIVGVEVTRDANGSFRLSQPVLTN